MVRAARLFIVMAILTGCAEQSTRSNEPVYDPWTRHWESQPAGAESAEIAWTFVAWPTGDPATADLSVEKAFPAEPVPGAEFEGRLVVTNLTDGPLVDLSLTERLGLGMRLTASSPQGRSSSAGIYRWELGTIGPGERRTIRVTGRVEGRGPIMSSTSARYRTGGYTGRNG